MIRHFALLLLCALALKAAEPSPAEFKAQADRCRRILNESLVQFYLPACLDRENGGYLEYLEGGKFVPKGEKFLTLQARQLWFFSLLASEGIQRQAALDAARHGYEFITKKMKDPVHGGYYSRVTDSGEVKDARKHAYLNSFAIYGFTAYANASKDPAALNSARELFEIMDEKAHDSEFGGYIEFFERDWTPVTDPKAQGYVGAIGHKTYNTHLHLLESFAELSRSWTNSTLQQRLHELIDINISTVHFPTENNNVDAYLRDWTVVNEARNLRASYGHDIECVWLVMDAARTGGLSPALLRSWAAGLAENCLKYGYDKDHGGFFESGPLGENASVTKKTWWVQAEALLGLLEMYRLTGDAKFYQAFTRTLDFCERFQVAREGGWWATRAADGSPTDDKSRSNQWQGAYHAGRAMLYAAKWLEEMSRP